MTGKVSSSTSIQNLQDKLQQGLSELSLPEQPKHLYEAMSYMLKMGGKRLRPTLLLMTCDMFEGDIDQALSPAIGIELFHNFTLIHDDIMDEAPLRRGEASVHQKFGRNTAILAGDLMFNQAMGKMTQVPSHALPLVLEYFNDTAAKVCEGQQMDMNFENNQQVEEQKYIDMVVHKTASLIAGSLAIGSILASADRREIELMYHFGKNCGIAFQLRDDVLDIFGKRNKTGKQIGGDIVNNKKTYLLVKAYQNANAQQADRLTRLMQSEKKSTNEKIQQVYDLFNALKVRQGAEKAINSYLDKGYKALEKIKVSPERKEPLHSMAQRLAHRDK